MGPQLLSLLADVISKFEVVLCGGKTIVFDVRKAFVGARWRGDGGHYHIKAPREILT